MKFTGLVAQISGIDGAARYSAGRALQQILSVRNCLIGISSPSDSADVCRILVPSSRLWLDVPGRYNFRGATPVGQLGYSLHWCIEDSGQ